jgi:putative inorganic carbon (hco3(-)) transporter
MKAILSFFRYHMLLRKMNTRAGAVILGLAAVLFGALVAYGNSIYGILLVGALAEVILIMVAVIFPLTGFYITVFISAFIFYPERITGTHLPISVAIEFLTLAVYIGILLRNRTAKVDNTGFYRAPYSIALLGFFIFLLIEVFNPNMFSVAGWSLYMRRFLDFLLVYYIGFQLIDDLPKIRTFIKFWIFLSMLNAIYTCKQQFFGFTWFELKWLHDNPHLTGLYFQGGEFRKFSFLSDPAANGIMMASMSVFTIILGLDQEKRRKKWLLILCGIVMILAMEFTGTRTASVITVGGVLFYILMTLNQKRTFYFAAISVFIFLFFFFAPIDNGTINRFRSSFRSDEGSLQVRNDNRKMIQPYIYKHPFGGGLYTSGYDGWVYNYGHPLAGFPPDSGFLKLAIETGWIGYAVALFSYMGLIFQGVHYYFKARDKEIKLYILAFTTGIFIFIIAQYTQVSIGQFPSLFFFYPGAALLIRLLQIDKRISGPENEK